MEFRDLKQQYKQLKTDIDKAVQTVMETCNFISGYQVQELEQRLAAYTGMKHCICCGNGTDAMSMVLMAWKIGAGDAVFVPDFTFFATAEVVAFAGATPIFVDVDPRTFNMDPKSLEKAILRVKSEGVLIPKVIIPVDLFGLPADYRKIDVIAKKYGLLVLEDAAQGFGGTLDGKQACSFGDAATTSFFPAKPLGCYGDGGAVFTNDDTTADYIRSIQVHGKGSHKYENIRIGLNSRLDTLQAAILLVKLDAFKKYEFEAVQGVAQWYDKNLPDTLIKPVTPEGFSSSWALYTIQIKNRDITQSQLKEEGIPTMVYYPTPLHDQKAFQNLPKLESCTVSERLCKEVLSLPIHPYLEIPDLEKIATLLHGQTK